MSRRASKKAAEKAAKDAKRKANAAAWAAATPQQKRTAYIIMGVIGAVIAVIVIVAAVSSHSGGSGGGTGGGGHPDPSVMLAQEDGSTDYATYTAALDNWAADCTQTRYQAAAIVHGTFEVEQQHGGTDTSRLQVMRHLAASVPADVAPTNCRDIAAAYLTLVGS